MISLSAYYSTHVQMSSFCSEDEIYGWRSRILITNKSCLPMTSKNIFFQKSM